MVKDLQLLKDITSLFEKKLIIWGIGKKGREIIQDIISMGAGRKGILLCDSDSKLLGDSICGNEILSPKDLRIKDAMLSGEDVAVLVTPISAKAQDEIIEEIEKYGGGGIRIYILRNSVGHVFWFEKSMCGSGI